MVEGEGDYTQSVAKSQRTSFPEPEAPFGSYGAFLRDGYPLYSEALDNRVPLDSLEHQTVRHYLLVKSKVTALEDNAITGMLEAKKAGRSELASVYDGTAEVVAEIQHLVHIPGGSRGDTAFVAPVSMRGSLGPAAALFGMHLELLAETKDYDMRAWTEVPTELVPRVAAGLWRRERIPGDDPTDRARLGREYALAALEEPRGDPWPDWREYGAGKPFDEDAVRIIDQEATRLGLPEDLTTVDPALARFLTVVHDARAVVEATDPRLVNELPPAPGLQPTAQDRLATTHQFGRLYLATLELAVGREPPADLASGLSTVLRPYGLAVLVDPTV